ncbi:DNA polymerase III subunit theta [Gibbsiella quercinecans]|uniref:DNA polymerase III subunit theta n=1 Tax=Gibbsiella quercinecans TaxID=929813 RepID=UPI00242FEDC1|nr:DNA polymerase III subunit theta [Gibbsiella quercinecans]
MDKDTVRSSQAEDERVAADLLALTVTYYERYGHESNLKTAEKQVPAHLRSYFHQQLKKYRTTPPLEG